MENDEDKKELDESYLHNTGKGIDPKDSIKLQLNKYDNTIYSKLLSSKKPSKSDFTKSELQSRICKNYFYFVEKLNELKIIKIENIWDAFNRLNIIDPKIRERIRRRYLKV